MKTVARCSCTIFIDIYNWRESAMWFIVHERSRRQHNRTESNSLYYFNIGGWCSLPDNWPKNGYSTFHRHVSYMVLMRLPASTRHIWHATANVWTRFMKILLRWLPSNGAASAVYISLSFERIYYIVFVCYNGANKQIVKSSLELAQIKTTEGILQCIANNMTMSHISWLKTDMNRRPTLSK